MLSMAPGGCSGKSPAVPGGEKFALVYSGELTLTLDKEVHALKQGDSITFSTATTQQWDNTGKIPVEVVLVSLRTLP